MGTLITLIIFAAVVLIALTTIASGIKIVQQSEVMVIERFGSYRRTLEHGMHFLVPFIDQPRAITMIRYEKHGDQHIPISRRETRIDRRETVMDFPGQPVVTTDNVTVRIDGALYFQIINPSDAIYKVENVSQAIEVLAKTTLRSEVGKMELDKLFESRAEVNNAILVAMEAAAEKWGVKINRVEIQDIVMPTEIQEAMNLQMTAERKRRAHVTEAEGKKAAAIAEAQGQRESDILTAEGDKQAAVLRAEGEKESISLVLSSLGNTADAQQMVVGYLLGQRYIAMLPDMAKDGERVFVPYEASSLVGAMGMMKHATDAPGEVVGKHLTNLGSGVIGSHAS